MDMSQLRKEMFPNSTVQRMPTIRSQSLRYGIRPRTKKTPGPERATHEQYATYVDLIGQLGRNVDPNAEHFGPIIMAGIINSLRRDIGKRARKDEPARSRTVTVSDIK